MIRLPWLRILLFACLWWILAEGRVDGWLLGCLAVIAATWTSMVLHPPAAPRLHLGALPAFLVYFLINSVRGGGQVAFMALRGRRALQPVFLELPVNLPVGAPQVLLITVLSLMPGTVGVELADDRLRLHVLHQDLPVVAEAKALERHIAALFGVGI
ncbi:MAG: Na+/H+ antiporter subunit E [Azonexus sp.]|nr:Na+/H+ antiporter subunit E [Azonexus sp.]